MSRYEDLDRRAFADCLWADEHSESFWAKDIDEWLEDLLGEWAEYDPPTVEVCGYRRDVIPGGVPSPEDVLEFLHERPLLEYLNQDEPWDPPDEVVEAAVTLCAAVREHTEVWSCSRVVVVTVDVAAWRAVRGGG